MAKRGERALALCVKHTNIGKMAEIYETLILRYVNSRRTRNNIETLWQCFKETPIKFTMRGEISEKHNRADATDI